MKSLLLLATSLVFAFTTFGQRKKPDSGFTRIEEAKNLMVNGMKEGKWLEYVYPDSDKKQKAIAYRLILYKEGKPFGIVREYFIDIWKVGVLQAEIPYVDGKVKGVIKLYYKMGKLLAEIPVFNGRRNGTEKIYYRNGALICEIPFTGDTINGMMKGNCFQVLAEVPFTKGNINGIVKEYSTKLKLRLIGGIPFNNGKADGQVNLYDDSGKVAKVIPYQDVSPNEIKSVWFEYGELTFEYPFKNSSVNRVEQWYKGNGSKI